MYNAGLVNQTRYELHELSLDIYGIDKFLRRPAKQLKMYYFYVILCNNITEYEVN